MSDAVPNPSTRPVWLSTTTWSQRRRLVAIRLAPDTTPDAVNDIFSLGVKYDLVLFDPRAHRVLLPQEEMAAYASATFWPGGAVQAAVAGGFGLVLAIIGWFLPIPIVGWILIIVGGFLFVMAVFTFVHEGRTAMRVRGSRRDTPLADTMSPGGPPTHPATGAGNENGPGLLPGERAGLVVQELLGRLRPQIGLVLDLHHPEDVEVVTRDRADLDVGTLAGRDLGRQGRAGREHPVGVLVERQERVGLEQAASRRMAEGQLEPREFETDREARRAEAGGHGLLGSEIGEEAVHLGDRRDVAYLGGGEAVIAVVA